MLLTQLEREKIHWERPTFTLDVNQIALRPPDLLDQSYHGLPQLEWNYFERSSVELCVTPQSSDEITLGRDLSQLGQAAFRRYQKTQLFKLRPSNVSLDLTDQEADQLWTGMRQMLFPTVTDELLLDNQIHNI